MQWLGPELAARYESPHWPVLLLICPDIDRMQSRELTLHAAGYVVASATTLYAAQEMSHLCNFDLVVLDHEFASQQEAADIQERHASVLLEPGTSEQQLLNRVTEILQGANTSSAVH
jgi:hypothetical protein